MDYMDNVAFVGLTDSLLITLIYLFQLMGRALFLKDLLKNLFKNKYLLIRMLNFSLTEALEDVVVMVEEELMDLMVFMVVMQLNSAVVQMEEMEAMVKMVGMVGVVAMEEARVTFCFNLTHRTLTSLWH